MSKNKDYLMMVNERERIIQKYGLKPKLKNIVPCIVNPGPKLRISHHDNLFRSVAKLVRLVAKQLGKDKELAFFMASIIPLVKKRFALLIKEDELIAAITKDLRSGSTGQDHQANLKNVRDKLSSLQDEINWHMEPVVEMTKSFRDQGFELSRPFGETTDTNRNTILLDRWEEATDTMMNLKRLNPDMTFYVKNNPQTGYFGIHCKTFKQDVPGEIQISQKNYFEDKVNFCDELSAISRLNQSTNAASVQEIMDDEKMLFKWMRKYTGLDEAAGGLKQLADGLNVSITPAGRKTAFAHYFRRELCNADNQPDYDALDDILLTVEVTNHVLYTQGILCENARLSTGRRLPIIGKKNLEVGFQSP